MSSQLDTELLIIVVCSLHNISSENLKIDHTCQLRNLTPKCNLQILYLWALDSEHTIVLNSIIIYCSIINLGTFSHIFSGKTMRFVYG